LSFTNWCCASDRAYKSERGLVSSDPTADPRLRHHLPQPALSEVARATESNGLVDAGFHLAFHGSSAMRPLIPCDVQRIRVPGRRHSGRSPKDSRICTNWSRGSGTTVEATGFQPVGHVSLIPEGLSGPENQKGSVSRPKQKSPVSGGSGWGFTGGNKETKDRIGSFPSCVLRTKIAFFPHPSMDYSAPAASSLTGPQLTGF